MANRKTIIATALTLISLTVLLLITENKPKTRTQSYNPTVAGRDLGILSRADELNNIDPIMVINSFSLIPPKMEGYSCYFSNDSTAFQNGEYIYMVDNEENAFLKINSILTKFKQTYFNDGYKEYTITKYRSPDYEMTVEIRGKMQSGYETSIKTGTIRLVDKSGKILKKPFYGQCD